MLFDERKAVRLVHRAGEDYLLVDIADPYPRHTHYLQRVAIVTLLSCIFDCCVLYGQLPVYFLISEGRIRWEQRQERSTNVVLAGG